MCVCVCVCVCARAHVHASVCVFVSVCMYFYVCLYSTLQVNNAGCMVHERQHQEDGLEVNFATNTVGEPHTRTHAE